MTVSTQAPAGPDYAAIKGRQRQTWASGDYQVIAAIIVPVSERLCDAVDLRAGERVLDVATGSGNTAIAAARRLCEVTGVDYVPALLERGRARADAEGLGVALLEGDGEPFGGRAGAPPLQQGGHVVHAGHLAQAARSRDGGVAAAGGHVQHALAGAQVHSVAQPLAHGDDEGRNHLVIAGGPGLLLAALDRRVVRARCRLRRDAHDGSPLLVLSPTQSHARVAA